MPSIDIRRTHSLGLEQAHAAVDKVAQRMREKFGVDTRWDDDTLRFSHMGVDGGIAVSAHDVHVQARLGMLVSALKPRIENEIHAKLDEYFGPAKTP
ncbi:polyhydroxyalkanoic acid system family protein [Oleiagrimonas sp. MCCC 1A03011]|jgi:putative polyhydroxyalkanoate system protein|uniref:polyhydroxyalkanoic acid system family protein n=1 Tax=Oleiagrimonas sp. MCCC 1A03011 TaxID=1926883 RepID=UPI000DC30375|nr:polyhydroxyalkanoic acid system family protein [Oleiagrimonas sp. MCCC 1A03011]RAP57820.1 polyhydroxyalkanoic acid synthase [Oleiagrimonas sp. MCCC 1A03011]